MTDNKDIDRKLDELEKRVNTRLDRIANVNSGLVANQEDIKVALRRLDNTLLALVDRMDILGSAFYETYGALIQHMRDHREG